MSVNAMRENHKIRAFSVVVFLLLASATVPCTTITSASEFYDASVETRRVVADLQVGQGVRPTPNQNDSEKLQQVIDRVSGAGGGVVRIPAGAYWFGGIQIKSNVHIEISKDAVIHPWIARSNKSVSVFDLGTDTLAIENVSVRGIDGQFLVKIPKHEPGVRVFSLSNVRNFLIENCSVEDCLTRFSAIQFSPSGLKSGLRAIPTSGTVRGITVRGAHYGYGVVQAQAAKSVFFEDLLGVGGATLRLETGAAAVNDSQFGGVDRIYGKNIRCIDGNVAVMLSPHAMTNGIVNVDGVVAEGCGFAVRVESGFVAKKYSTGGLTRGTFANGCSIKNVKATFGRNAQIKPKHFKYMPDPLRNQLQSMEDSEDGESVRGPSIAAVLRHANYPIEVTNVDAVGFEFSTPIVDGPGKNAKAKPKSKSKRNRKKAMP